MNEQEQQLLLEIADDELILGWRDSEWTGIAPLLEEDVAFSSIAQNEIGHARALYELVGTRARHDRGRAGVRPLTGRVPLRADRRAAAARLGPDDRAPLPLRGSGRDQARTLKQSDDPEIAGLAAKIDREEAYHRMHAQMWYDRLQDEPRFTAALEELRPQAAALLDSDLRGEHTSELAELWEEMTMVRRSQPAGTKW